MEVPIIGGSVHRGKQRCGQWPNKRERALTGSRSPNRIQETSTGPRKILLQQHYLHGFSKEEWHIAVNV